MSYRIVMSSFAAVAIGMSCMATDASARGGGGGGGRSGGPAPGVMGGLTGGAGARYYGPAFNKSAVPTVRWIGSTGSFSGATMGGGGGNWKWRRYTVGDPPKGGETGTFGATPGSSASPTSAINAGDPTGGGATAVPGGSVAAGVGFYAPASYDSNAACGRYPYPPCNAVCGRYPYPHCNKVPTQ
jgi:hypothetical protein